MTNSIAVSKSAYHALTRAKCADESYSQVILRLLANQAGVSVASELQPVRAHRASQPVKCDLKRLEGMVIDVEINAEKLPLVGKLKRVTATDIILNPTLNYCASDDVDCQRFPRKNRDDALRQLKLLLSCPRSQRVMGDSSLTDHSYAKSQITRYECVTYLDSE